MNKAKVVFSQLKCLTPFRADRLPLGETVQSRSRRSVARHFFASCNLISMRAKIAKLTFYFTIFLAAPKNDMPLIVCLMVERKDSQARLLLSCHLFMNILSASAAIIILFSITWERWPRGKIEPLDFNHLQVLDFNCSILEQIFKYVVFFPCFSIFLFDCWFFKSLIQQYFFFLSLSFVFFFSYFLRVY